MKKGFTLIELLVVMGIMSILLMLVVINVIKPQSSTALEGATNTLISDLKSQQLKSMVGETGTAEASPSGIVFASDKYTLFSGVHSTTDPLNFEVALGSGVRISTTFPDSRIIFATGSGEVIGFSPGANTITLQWNNSATQTIIINKYGVATNIN